jgi:3'-phosphoadenosine 5'-phosphosulfate sulfotransferase (PAPS reductase)/FAD synthetase
MKHIVGLSGGKDSTALALRLMEVEPRDYEYICNETGNELPDMLAHWAKLEEMLGKPIIRVRHDRDLEGTIDQMNMLPNVFSRWCTRVLKIEPTIDYMGGLPEGSTLYVGLRADEEARRGLYGEDITIRFPMREWGWKEEDVWKYLDQRGVCIPARTD